MDGFSLGLDEEGLREKGSSSSRKKKEKRAQEKEKQRESGEWREEELVEEEEEEEGDKEEGDKKKNRRRWGRRMRRRRSGALIMSELLETAEIPESCSKSVEVLSSPPGERLDNRNKLQTDPSKQKSALEAVTSGAGLKDTEVFLPFFFVFTEEGRSRERRRRRCWWGRLRRRRRGINILLTKSIGTLSSEEKQPAML